jgi:hypothetical protein
MHADWWLHISLPQPRSSTPEADFLFFGLVVGQERELGYFSLSELETVRGPLGLPIERDLSFKPCPLSRVMRREIR